MRTSHQLPEIHFQTRDSIKKKKGARMEDSHLEGLAAGTTKTDT